MDKIDARNLSPRCTQGPARPSLIRIRQELRLPWREIAGSRAEPPPCSVGRSTTRQKASQIWFTGNPVVPTCRTVACDAAAGMWNANNRNLAKAIDTGRLDAQHEIPARMGDAPINACNAPGRQPPTRLRPDRFHSTRHMLHRPAHATSLAAWNPSRTSTGMFPT